MDDEARLPPTVHLLYDQCTITTNYRCVTHLDQLFVTSISDVMRDEEYDLFICTSVTYPEQQAWVVLAGNFSRVGYVH